MVGTSRSVLAGILLQYCEYNCRPMSSRSCPLELGSEPSLGGSSQARALKEVSAIWQERASRSLEVKSSRNRIQNGSVVSRNSGKMTLSCYDSNSHESSSPKSLIEALVDVGKQKMGTKETSFEPQCRFTQTLNCQLAAGSFCRNALQNDPF